MRYYRIDFTDKTTGKPIYFLGGGNGQAPSRALTSEVATPGGTITNPGALNIELDIFQTVGRLVDNNSYFRVWGPSKNDLARNFNPTVGSVTQPTVTVAISVGMSKGLPLANPAQQGLIVTADVWQCFSNWIGTAMTMDFYLIPSGMGPSNVAPADLVLNWKAGTPLSQALAQMFSQALPNAKQQISISPNLVRNYDVVHVHGSFQQMCDFVAGQSWDILGSRPGYYGVQMSYNGAVVVATDHTQTTPAVTPKIIQPWDLIGQPTWLGPFKAQAKFVMRGDLAVLGTIQLPQTAQISRPGSFPALRDKITLPGNFIINSLRHVGNFRQPSADAWVTIAELLPAPAPAPT